MSSPVSPVIANIYREYFEEMALGPQCPILTAWWRRYADDVISITKRPDGHPVQGLSEEFKRIFKDTKV